MNLPLTSTSLLFWCDPSERFVFRDSNNKITSVIEKMSDKPLLPASTSTAPTWVANVVNGQPIMRFAGGQSLKFDFDVRNITTGTKNPTIITVVAKATSLIGGDNTIVEIGSPTISNTGLALVFNSPPTAQTYRYDDTSGLADQAVFTGAVSAFHVWTAIYDGTNLTIRKDGVQISSNAATHSTGHFSGNQIVIGDYTDGGVGGFGHAYVTGDIGQVIVYGGTSADLDTEIYLGQLYGIF